MFEQTAYAEEKLRELRLARVHHAERRVAGNPDAEIPRSCAGQVHEVFRRIAEGAKPERPAAKRRWIVAG